MEPMASDSAPEERAAAASLPELRARAEDLFRARRHEEARAAFLTLAETAAAAGDRGEHVEGLALAARMETLLGRLPEARALLAAAFIEASPDEPLGWSRCLLIRGIVEREEGDREAARATFEEAYRYSREHGLELRAVDAAHFVAMLGDLDTSLEWTGLALASAEAAGDERWQAVLWNNLGWTLSEAQRHEEAHDALSRARHFHHRAGDERARHIADWSLGHATRRLGRLEEARALLEPVLTWAEARHDRDPTPDAGEWLGLAHRELGYLAADEGRPGAALAHLEQAAALLSAAGMGAWAPEDLADLERRVESLRAAPGSDRDP